MTAIPLDTHKAIKRLQSAGMNEKQAEEMVSLFGEMFANEAATKSDVEVLHKDLKADLSEMKTDLSWIKKFMFGVGLAVLIAALKYIFVG
ncbi:DUF1640 domain-containing protein [Enterovibrio nigricans]|uniref:DUF1640 domain-containing protein n=1 Tax=Enterovibrio nigricans DSM 22720 TaxID=1121868 RepID=A0A1T4V8T2_9GAMM|nr:DUF1640 domain-containing protein [Enterovibrio nigricans]PKF50235.1 DUF1640 domain-containing protein [Enterovibrio nigricans]SKA61359.1 Protein of unknown function [Enterovibrio nigricans DSM 22720]